jgi:hypothetical protein
VPAKAATPETARTRVKCLSIWMFLRHCFAVRAALRALTGAGCRPGVR